MPKTTYCVTIESEIVIAAESPEKAAAAAREVVFHNGLLISVVRHESVSVIEEILATSAGADPFKDNGAGASLGDDLLDVVEGELEEAPHFEHWPIGQSRFNPKSNLS
jgi:hypothetical protein